LLSRLTQIFVTGGQISTHITTYKILFLFKQFPVDQHCNHFRFPLI
jgi:hypothetical protein